MVKTMPERCPGNKEEGARLCLRGRTFSRKLPHDIQQVAFRKLRMLNRAIRLKDLAIPPANRLEMLGGDRSGQHSIRINDQWRICFKWQEGDAFEVEIVNYH
jgi:toxin HigB-1